MTTSLSLVLASSLETAILVLHQRIKGHRLIIQLAQPLDQVTWIPKKPTKA